MFARVLLAVLLCGIAAGFTMGVMQQVRLTPLILQAEAVELQQAQTPHQHDVNAPAEHHHDATAWMPESGFERTFYTYVTAILASTGFAAMLAGIAFIGGVYITPANGWIWGLCGFIAVSLAPAAGLAPELPGMLAADVVGRQMWWVGTAIATALALWLLAFGKRNWALPFALIAAFLPHVIGAPQLEHQPSNIPPNLSAQFVGASLAANAMMWLIIGLLLGRFLPQQDLDTQK